MNTNRIVTGDALDELGAMPASSVHAVVTDPPYGLAFMGRDWDDFEPKEYQKWCENWARRAKRVLKPGGHLLAFSGNRTHHRLFTGVEDAGFEIRDTLTWHYGSGFPKAADVGKTIDKRADAEREDLGPNPNAVGRSYNKTGGDYNDDHKEDRAKQDRITAPATDAAKKWDGWKTGLKPATEYVVMARKPFDGATVDCVLEHGTGALNIDATRIGTDEDTERPVGTAGGEGSYHNDLADDDTAFTGLEKGDPTGGHDKGRYPSNVIFDEAEAERLDEEVGELGGGEYRPADSSERDAEVFDPSNGWNDNNMNPDAKSAPDNYGGKGGPSRYFYTSKASKSERTEDGQIENAHPTVKPQDLMEWLVRLVTREGQVVLDPFAGSGTTCKAAKSLGRQFVGIEQQAKWADVARVRCNLTPEDPSVVRDDETQQGLEQY